MNVRVASHKFEIHTVPLERFWFDDQGDFFVEFDEAGGKRIRIRFPGGGIALKITLVDCFDLIVLEINGEFPRHILEVQESPWVSELAAKYRARNPFDDLMDRVQHIVLPLGDNIVEVATWEYTVEQVQ